MNLFMKKYTLVAYTTYCNKVVTHLIIEQVHCHLTLCIKYKIKQSLHYFYLWQFNFIFFKLETLKFHTSLAFKIVFIIYVFRLLQNSNAV